MDGKPVLDTHKPLWLPPLINPTVARVLVGQWAEEGL